MGGINSMKAVIVTPDEHKFLKNAGDRAPLGAMYISAALEENGINTGIIDLNHTFWHDAIYYFRKEKPDITCLSVTSSPVLRQMQAFSRAIRPYTKTIIAGGSHPTARPQDMQGFADYIVQGYGESQLINYIDSVDMPENFDINRYPIPRRDKLRPESYNMEIRGLRATGMVTSRGCPFSCSFCGNMSKKPTHRSIDNIAEELDIIKHQGYDAVYLYDENWLTNKERAGEIADMLYFKDIKYRIETRARTIDESTTRMLRDTGCIMVGMGIESGDDRVLQAMGKHETTSDMVNAVKLLGKYEVPVKGYFIFGLPYQDNHSAQSSIDLSKHLRHHGMVSADFYALQCFPGSPISDNPEKYGVDIFNKDYRKYLIAKNGKTPITCETKFLKREEISYWIEKARREWNGN